MTTFDAPHDLEPDKAVAPSRSSQSALKCKVLLFGAARELAGCDEFELKIECSAATTAAEVFERVLQIYPDLRRFGRSLLMAVNQEYATPEKEVRDGDEIALFPPVSGGSGAIKVETETQSQDFFELTVEPIDVGTVARRFVSARCGATVTLDGYARAYTKNHPRTLYLIYEAYAPMALAEMQRLGAQAHRLFDIEHIGIVHRTGRMEIGETSVVISVSAPHRRAAFEACEWAIKELKRTVPIWKKEFYEDGSVWLEGETNKI